MPFRHRNQIHIPVQSAIEGKICLLRVNPTVLTVIHENNQYIFFPEFFRDIDTKRGIATLMMCQLFPIHIYFRCHGSTTEFNPCLLIFRKFRRSKLLYIPAGATVIIVSAILPVDGIPCVGQGDLLPFRCHCRFYAHILLYKNPAIIYFQFLSHKTFSVLSR